MIDNQFDSQTYEKIKKLNELSKTELEKLDQNKFLSLETIINLEMRNKENLLKGINKFQKEGNDEKTALMKYLKEKYSIGFMTNLNDNLNQNEITKEIIFKAFNERFDSELNKNFNSSIESNASLRSDFEKYALFSNLKKTKEVNLDSNKLLKEKIKSKKDQRKRN